MFNVFVYGTLKPGEINYFRYCAGKTCQERLAYAWGKLYALCLGYPGMAEGTERIQGVILTFEDEGVLEQLDQLESYSPSRPAHENEYQRREIIVYDGSGKPLDKAWTYIMSDQNIRRFKGVWLPSGCWSSYDSQRGEF